LSLILVVVLMHRMLLLLLVLLVVVVMAWSTGAEWRSNGIANGRTDVMQSTDEVCKSTLSVTTPFCREIKIELSRKAAKCECNVQIQNNFLAILRSYGLHWACIKTAVTQIIHQCHCMYSKYIFYTKDNWSSFFEMRWKNRELNCTKCVLNILKLAL